MINVETSNISYSTLHSGFDVADLSEDAPGDMEGLDASAAHVANLLSTEPSNSRFFPASSFFFLISFSFALYSGVKHKSDSYLSMNMIVL